MNSNELREKIIEQIASAEETETEAGRVKRRSVSQLIKALDELDKIDAKEKGTGRIGFFKIRNRD